MKRVTALTCMAPIDAPPARPDKNHAEHSGCYGEYDQENRPVRNTYEKSAVVVMILLDERMIITTLPAMRACEH